MRKDIFINIRIDDTIRNLRLSYSEELIDVDIDILTEFISRNIQTYLVCLGEKENQCKI